MADYNRAIILGNVGKVDPTRNLPNGAIALSFSVATNEEWKDKSGEKQERTEWHSVDVYGALATVCEKHLNKGMKVMVDGRIETRSWEKEGVKQYKTSVRADRVLFLGNRQVPEEDEITF